MSKSERKIPDVVLHLLILALLPIASILLGFLWVFRQLIGLWLQVKLGDQYGGLLSSSDKVYLHKADKTPKLILVLSYIRSDTKVDMFDKLKANIEKKIFNQPNSFTKLTSTHHKFLGQNYLLKNQVSWDDIGKKMPLPSNRSIYFDKEYLKRLMGSMSNAALPINDTALWELQVATEPLIDKDEKGYTYPVLFRIHHAVADGIRLVALLSVLCNGKHEKYYCSETTSINFSYKNAFHRILKVVESILYFSHLAFIGTVTLLKIFFLKKRDRNIFKESCLSRENLIAWATENENRYVSIVKEIKSAIPNSRFSDVLFSCISASIFNYFKKRGGDVPKNISFLVPILFTLPSIDGSKPLELKNNFTFACLDLPIVNPAHFIDDLKQTIARTEQMRQNLDKHAIFLFLNYISAVIPPLILKILLNTSAYSGVISNVPGISRTELLDDCELMGIVGTAPHTDYTGVTFTIFTYDNKFHICIMVDKAIIPLQEDAQYIVDDIFRNMEILYKNSLRINK